MSGLAEILLSLGFAVSGSDAKLSATCKRLERLGAVVHEGHDARHLSPDASLVVYSSAVRADNPEMEEAARRNLPIIRRAEVLAELMRLKFGVGVAGSHGKTTTTSMVAAILERGGLDPTVVIGGQVKALGTGGRVGKSEYLVAETDESDRSFLLLKPTVAIVTNIDAEHLSAYSSLADLEQSFYTFVSAVPFYGLAILCVDDRRVRDLYNRYTGRKLSFGFSPDAQIRAANLEHEFQKVSFDVFRGPEKLFRARIGIPGRHMVSNALAAIGVGLEFGISHVHIVEALDAFAGVGRRTEIVAEQQGITFINDYAHHPTEIKATLSAIKEGWKSSLRKLHVVFQPHRYSRTKDCFVDFLNAFEHADNVLMTPIYAASEDPIEGITAESLLASITHTSKHFVSSLDEVAARLLPDLQAGDVVACLGAGSIGSLADNLSQEFTQFAAPKRAAAM